MSLRRRIPDFPAVTFVEHCVLLEVRGEEWGEGGETKSFVCAFYQGIVRRRPVDGVRHAEEGEENQLGGGGVRAGVATTASSTKPFLLHTPLSSIRRSRFSLQYTQIVTNVAKGYRM